MGTFGKRATCETIRDLSGQMARLATEEGLDVLGYTLGMATLEEANILTALEGERPPLVPAAGCEPRRKPSETPAEAIAL